MKNIAWAVGAVIYSGKETKIMMNSKKQKAFEIAPQRHSCYIC